MRASAFTIVLSAAAAACTREGAPPVAPVEVAVADLGDAGVMQIPIAPPSPSTRERCTARLTPATIQTGSGCTLDERLSKGAGLLLYPCSGTGVVEAVFGEHRFDGSMNDGSMILNLTTEIDWEDGCHWQTKQRIRGELHGEGKNAKLAWTYSEGPVSGSGCYGSCKATADIDVEASSARP
jgi:hypothetical protein